MISAPASRDEIEVGNGPLVVDLSDSLAGGVCGQFLADLGCTVVALRRAGLHQAGALWTRRDLARESADRGKLILSPSEADMTDEETASLLAGADAVLTEFGSAAAAEKWWFHEVAASAQPLPPVLAVLSLDDGTEWDSAPLPDEAAAVLRVTNRSGLAELQGGILEQTSFVEHCAGTNLAIGLLAAIIGREAGQPQPPVLVSLWDVALNLQSAPLAEYGITGHMHRQEEYSARFPVVGVYEAADGPLYLAAVMERQFSATLEVVGRDDLVTDPRFARPEARAENREALRDVLATAFASRNREYWLTELAKNGVMAGHYRSIGELIEYEQLAANNVLRPGRTLDGTAVCWPRLPHLNSCAEGIASPDRPARFVSREQAAALPSRREAARWSGRSSEQAVASIRRESGIGSSPSEGRPLAGLRVIDLTHAVAGPAATQILADLGAEVCKLETPPHGDFLRAMSPFGFESFNRNKRSHVLDLKSDHGRLALRELVPRADVFVHSQRPDVLHRFGFDVTAVRALNPTIIFAELSGFGLLGREWNRPGIDGLLQAESGLAYLQGGVIGNVSAIDQMAGVVLAANILGAERIRRINGSGGQIHVSLLEVAVWLSSGHIAAAGLVSAGGSLDPLDPAMLASSSDEVARDYVDILDGLQPRVAGHFDVLNTVRGDRIAVPSLAFRLGAADHRPGEPAPRIGEGLDQVRLDARAWSARGITSSAAEDDDQT